MLTPNLILTKDAVQTINNSQKTTQKHFLPCKQNSAETILPETRAVIYGMYVTNKRIDIFPTYQLINYPRSTHRFYPHEQYLHHHIQSEYRNIFLIKLSEGFYIRFIVQMKMFISHCLSLS